MSNFKGFYLNFKIYIFHFKAKMYKKKKWTI